MSKLILLSFDYELFLGNRSGNVQDCLVKPTDQLLCLLGENKFKAVFFIDTIYLSRMMDNAAAFPAVANDLLVIKNQLTSVIKQGHYIFPHLHPHWLDAEYLPDINEWSLNNTRYYQFSSLSSEQQTSLFDASVAIIRSITDSVVPGYAIDCYRAGGWSIQPFDCFEPHFSRHQIKHEWSVIPGKYHFSDAHSFDFRNAPVTSRVYQFNKDVCVEEKDGQFTEWTISSLDFTPFEKWIDFKINGMIKRFKKRNLAVGATVASKITAEGDIYGNKDKVRVIASFELLNGYRVRKYLANIRKLSYYHFISHPKLLSEFDIKMMKKLFRSLKKIKSVETDFRKAQI